MNESELSMLSGRKLGRLGALISGFAHEIKNPLSTIGLNLSLMEEELAEPQGPREARFLKRTQRLSKEVDRIQGILEDFLAYVRGAQPRLQMTALNGLVRELADLVGPGIEKAGSTLGVFLEEGMPEIEVDPGLLHQALLNLVKNAEEALRTSQMTGEILLRTGILDIDGVPHALLSVMDSGPGMSEKTRASCFEPYFSTKPGGTGLGLALTQRFVEDLGGELLLETQEGTGTRFTIQIPVQPSDRVSRTSSDHDAGDEAGDEIEAEDAPLEGGSE